MRTAIAIRHIHFEHLGTFEAVLAAAGYKLHYHDVGASDFTVLDPLEPDLLIVLGGPVGVYETDAYPFLAEEQALLRRRLQKNLPTFGICLGAQQIAAALGASVEPTGTKEIGFGPVILNEHGYSSPLRHLENVPVLHWHGDAFSTPTGGHNLASTKLCSSQAFAIGKNVLGVQFHPEADACSGLEQWLIGHACELATTGIDPRVIRDDARRHGATLRQAARQMFTEWLYGIEW
ncbi:glutamine amidotransferase [Brucella tritici]|uniref:Glutamine amidotransferase n=1 Tax=Brucella tritici TaxID=94626 RepID=A0A6L3YMZ0_9HYPH|nr:glutamine amidotransferase [Brucella tritici]